MKLRNWQKLKLFNLQKIWLRETLLRCYLVKHSKLYQCLVTSLISMSCINFDFPKSFMIYILFQSFYNE